MGLNAVPSGERVRIGFFGRRNVGKSSLVNALTNQNLSVVSDTAGTTTDNVSKAMEILPIGPVVIIDTPGFDDEGSLGLKRVEKTREALATCDVAILVVDPFSGIGKTENELIRIFNENKTEYIIVSNKSDLKKGEGLSVSAKTNEGIDLLKEKIALLSEKTENKKPIISDLLKKGDTVLLVTPIDSSAPKGRLILPQVQTIRDILDAGANAFICTEKDYSNTLGKLKDFPTLVITDSQVFKKINEETPPIVPLTSFSILMARHKGILDVAVNGAFEIEKLKDGDKILISEGCTHKRQCEDIGTFKIPSWLKDFSGKNLEFHHTQGKDFPKSLSPYRLIVQCGGCMLTQREVKYRYQKALAENVPITNYGTLIAHINGILERSISFLN